MRGALSRVPIAVCIVAALIPLFAFAQEEPPQQDETFHWIDFHAEKDQPIVVWVMRSLDREKWSAIREIGVMYDAALVATTLRNAPDASPAADTFQLWSVSLTKHMATPLLKGTNLRWLDFMQFAPGAPREITLLYDDCRECAATTYFTAFHYDMREHLMVPRWLRGAEGVPVWTSVQAGSGTVAEAVNLTQVYAALPEPNGVEMLSTWAHYDYGTQKDPEDYVFRYDIDPLSGLDRTELLSGKDAAAMKQRLCSMQTAPGVVARGQDSQLCQQSVHPLPERKPVTTPPANNKGRSVPPKSH
jgi:hypothetical protein